jgi:hypothetical protein
LGKVHVKNLLDPLCLKKGPEAGSPPKYEFLMIFMVRVRTPVPVRFSRAKNSTKPRESYKKIDSGEIIVFPVLANPLQYIGG